MKYLQRLILSIFLCLALIQCSNNSRPGNTAPEPTGNNYIQVLDETPQHVQELENPTVFPGDAEPIYSIKLIPEQTYGKSGDYLTQVQDCVVDDNGSVIIVNLDTNYKPVLYAFNKDGTNHTQIGGQGKGPGEYGIVMFTQVKAGKLFLYDYTSQRLNIYNTDDYAFVRSTLIEQWAIWDHEATQGLKFGYFKARNDGNFLITFYEPNSGTGRPAHTYLLMDSSGNALNFEPLVFPSGLDAIKNNSRIPNSFRPLPFMGKTVSAISDENALYSAWTKDFLIKKYDATGVYQSAIYYPVTGSPFDLSDYTEVFNYSSRDVMNTLEIVDEELPEANPVIAHMKVDDENRIWVAVPTAVEGDMYEWWILKESGELLAKVLLPVEQQIYDIQNGYLYSKKTNEETGTEFVVKYRIKLTEK